MYWSTITAKTKSKSQTKVNHILLQSKEVSGNHSSGCLCFPCCLYAWAALHSALSSTSEGEEGLLISKSPNTQWVKNCKTGQSLSSANLTPPMFLPIEDLLTREQAMESLLIKPDFYFYLSYLLFYQYYKQTRYKKYSGIHYAIGCNKKISSTHLKAILSKCIIQIGTQIIIKIEINRNETRWTQ